ncbi:hypothetical protein M404DRAFT_993395 [Pisolithus tinctorius Marx 270]|uniref:Uncharacterized protein n=1 Tax=Pisolithus tinctorius Marx 270 TaxID=870435 RepID=A0A0C3PEY0_PISTI|nr:hypothetical protein M404DRAFT_993395 [Pisolithus tinctorius Marx 270]
MLPAYGLLKYSIYRVQYRSRCTQYSNIHPQHLVCVFRKLTTAQFPQLFTSAAQRHLPPNHLALADMVCRRRNV